MADPTIPRKGRLLTHAVSGGLFPVAVRMIWHHLMNVGGVSTEDTADARLTLPILSEQIAS